uniref:Protein kinase domain-containing protein n=1 Tax=Panagrellus redivivus TaxID=6233 RepID=A0A7E4WB46_PANRE
MMNSEKIIKLRKKFSRGTTRLIQGAPAKQANKNEVYQKCGTPSNDASSSRRNDKDSSRKIKKKLKSNEDVELGVSKKERKVQSGGALVKQGSGRLKGADESQKQKRKSRERKSDQIINIKNSTSTPKHERSVKHISSKRKKEKPKEQKDRILPTPPREIEKKDSAQKSPAPGSSPPDGCPVAEMASGRARKNSDEDAATGKKHSSDNEQPSTPCERETASIPIPQEVAATAFKVRDNDEDNREENEFTDVEADRPYNVGSDKVMLQPPAQLKLGTCVYEIVHGSVAGDYGSCIIKNVKLNEYCVLRYESASAKVKRLKTECTVLVLAAAGKRRHMLRLLMRGSMDDIHLKYLLTEGIGPALPDVLHQLGTRCFSQPTAFKLSLETIEAIEDLHRIGLIHRDIKPSAFSVGMTNQACRVYMTHFGLAKKYRSISDLKLIAPRKSVPFMGTVKYASRAVHKRGERSRRDDMESWLFVIVEFFCAKSLPWRKVADKTRVLERKQIFMTEAGIATAVSSSPRLPKEIKTITMHISALDFESGPDYHVYRKVLRDGMEHRRIWNNDPFEWEVDEPSQIRLINGSSRREDTVDSTQQQSDV